MTTVSRIAILCVPILLLLLLIVQFDMFLQKHFLSLVPVSLSLRNTHPDVILSDPGGPLLVSMAELALLPPPVLPHPTCSPPTLPRLPSSESKLPSDSKVILDFVQFPQLYRLPWLHWPTSFLSTLDCHDDAFRI